jgi:hypothetical protein
VLANKPSLPESQFITAEWDGFCVVFDRDSGSTHALDEITSALWLLPRSKQLVEPALGALKDRFANVPKNTLQVAIADSLTKLQELGMI